MSMPAKKAPPGPRSATDLLKSANNLPPVQPSMTPRSIDDGTIQVVNELFRELQGTFSAWRQAWPDQAAVDAAKRAYIKAFMESGINTLEQVGWGMQRARASASPWVPAPGEFVAWCQPTPEMLGIPSREAAFREALGNSHPSRFGSQREWSHPAVRHAALQCEIDNLSDLKSVFARRVFDRAYDITVRALMNGEPLGDIAIGIGHDSQKGEALLAEEHGDWRLQEAMARQSIPARGEDARKALLVRFGLGDRHAQA